MDLIQKLKEVQDKLEYNDDINIQRLKAILRALNGKTGKLLDVGCSDGRFMIHYIKKGFICEGIDISDKAIKFGRLRGLNLKKADVSKTIDFPSETFDVITCGQVLEHLIDPLFTVRNMHRMLKKNGSIIVTVPNIGMLRNIFLILMGKPPAYSCIYDGYHFRDYCKTEITRLLKEAGFRKIKVRGDKLNVPYWKGKLLTLYPYIPRYCDNLVVEAEKR